MDKYQKFCQEYDLPKYRYQQILHGVYKEFVSTYQEITTLPSDIQDDLAEQIPLTQLTHVHQHLADDGTIKDIWRTPTKHVIESVLIPAKSDRYTVCVSSMSGCPVGCTFCATGQMGFQENLSADMIVEQVLHYQRMLHRDDHKVTNVVFMGMGEPLLNLQEVVDAIEILIDPPKLGMSQRRITVSTSGYIHQLRELINLGYRGKIAISLHAPTHDLRLQLMPVVANANPLDKLMELLDKYVAITNSRVSYEYILIDQVNDQYQHAQALIELLGDRLAHVNLIPYNQVSGVSYQKPSRNHTYLFKRWLEKGRIPVSIRTTMGDDIGGACGQLAGTTIAA